MNYSQGIITKMAQKNYALMKPDMNINPFEIISNQIADLDLKLEKLYEKLSIQPDSSKAPLRLKAAADFIGVAPATLYSLVHHGKLRPLKPGKHLLFTQESLESYLRGERPEKPEIEDPSTYLIRNKKAAK